MWSTPLSDQEQEQEKKTFWYDEPNALEDVKKLDGTKRDWNFSPIGYDVAIRGGRVLNVAFVLGALLAAPSAVAVSPLVTLGCIALAGAVQTRKYFKRVKAIKNAFQSTVRAPEAVEELTANVFRRAGLPGKINETLHVSVLPPSRDTKDAYAKQLAYTVAIDPKKNHVYIGQSSLESLDRDELQAILGHEASHRINRHFMTCAHSMPEKTMSSALVFMGVASLLSLNVIALGYYVLAGVGSTIGRAYLKKLDEYRADRNGAAVSDSPLALVRGLDKLSDNIFNSLARNGDASASFRRGLPDGLTYAEREKKDFYKAVNNIVSPFAPHPKNENREAYLRKIAPSLPSPA